MFNKNKGKIKVNILYQKSFIAEDYNIANDVIHSSDKYQNISGSHGNPFAYTDNKTFIKLIHGLLDKKTKRVDKTYKKTIHQALRKNIERYLMHISPFFDTDSFTVLVSFDKESIFNSKENPYLCEKRISIKLKLYIKNKYIGDIVYVDEQTKNEFYSKSLNSFRTFKYSVSNYNLIDFNEDFFNLLDEKNIMLQNKEIVYTENNLIIHAIKQNLISDIKDFFSKKFDFQMSSIQDLINLKSNTQEYKEKYLLPLIKFNKNNKKSIQEFSIYHFIGYQSFWFSSSTISDLVQHSTTNSGVLQHKIGFYYIWPIRNMKSIESSRREYHEYDFGELTKSLFECDVLSLDDYNINLEEINESNFNELFELVKLMKY